MKLTAAHEMHPSGHTSSLTLAGWGLCKPRLPDCVCSGGGAICKTGRQSGFIWQKESCISFSPRASVYMLHLEKNVPKAQTTSHLPKELLTFAELLANSEKEPRCNGSCSIRISTAILNLIIYRHQNIRFITSGFPVGFQTSCLWIHCSESCLFCPYMSNKSKIWRFSSLKLFLFLTSDFLL